ncbi:pleckstrin homology domain-containing family G member 6-like isoform X1 [Polyodon spathula]|uniref:pleckstrin homology domain-containing family G member 6-like isoform X1 n=1 Tax=Polyodon spathula TaxID=7913 RepID=UPI001B7DB891|nr:pleckstrin homology domain-containing family G member 6-like isoform X1 [Polyodon spathula]
MTQEVMTVGSRGSAANGLVASRVEQYESGTGDSNCPEPAASLSPTHHRGAAQLWKLQENKPRKFGTLGYQVTNQPTNYQSKSKQKKHPEYVTLGKGSSHNPKHNRAMLRMGIFSQGPSEKDLGKVEQLKNKLVSYSMFGLPRLPTEVGSKWEIRMGEETGISLESSWKDIVQGHETMSKKQSHLQEAIWELIHTELTYMKKLRVITDLFICGILNLHSVGFLTDVDPELLFSNIPQIICAHRTFWQEVISPLLSEVRQTRKPFDPQRLHDGFQTFDKRFQSYIQYCAGEEHCMEYARQQMTQNQQFLVYVGWAETHKQCNRMRLSDMLARPHQRITKYPLMLKSILKRAEGSTTRDSLVSMVSSVESFLHHINSLLQYREELQKLSVAAGRIEGYEVLESASEEVDKHVKEFCQLDLTKPMVGVGPHHIRQLLLEDSLKIREGKDSKVEVHAFLFSDVLLFTKLSKKNETAKVTQAPVLIDRAVCRALKDPGNFLLICLNEFNCAIAAYTIQAASAEKSRQWMQSIQSAQADLIKLKEAETHRREKELREIIGEIESQVVLSTQNSPSLLHGASKSQQTEARNGKLIPQLVVTNSESQNTTLAKVEGQSEPGGPISPDLEDLGNFSRNVVSPRIRRRKPLHTPNRKTPLQTTFDLTQPGLSGPGTGSTNQGAHSLPDSNSNSDAFFASTAPDFNQRNPDPISNPDVTSLELPYSIPDHMLRTQRWLSASNHISNTLSPSDTSRTQTEVSYEVPEPYLSLKWLSADDLSSNTAGSYLRTQSDHSGINMSSLGAHSVPNLFSRTPRGSARSRSVADILLRAEALEKDWSSRHGSEESFSLAGTGSWDCSSEPGDKDQLLEAEDLEFVKGHAYSGATENQDAPFDPEEMEYMERLHNQLRDGHSPVFFDSSPPHGVWVEGDASEGRGGFLPSEEVVCESGDPRAHQNEGEKEKGEEGDRRGGRRLTLSELQKIRGTEFEQHTASF